MEKLILKDTEPEGTTKCFMNSENRKKKKKKQEASMVLTKHYIKIIVTKPGNIGMKTQPEL